jgi:hypothetical protein
MIQALSALSNVLHHRLPRELRDEIYSYVGDEDTLEATDYEHLQLRSAQTCYDLIERRRSGNGNKAYGCSCERPGDLGEIPLFTQSSIMGREVASEIVTCFYEKKLGFETRLKADDSYYAGIRKFLLGDVFHVGVIPIDCRFRQFTITHDGPSWVGPSKEPYADVHSAYALLAEISIRSDFELAIQYETWRPVAQRARWREMGVGIQQSCRFLLMIKPVVYTLRSKGAEVKVYVKSWSWLPSSSKEKWYAFDASDKLEYAARHWINFLRQLQAKKKRLRSSYWGIPSRRRGTATENRCNNARD